jgi:hypothetical protein
MLAGVFVDGGENRRPTIICIDVDQGLAGHADTRQLSCQCVGFTPSSLASP